MFKIGDMFVAFTGKDGGLSKSMKTAESYGHTVNKVFQTGLKSGAKLGAGGAEAFERIGLASMKAAGMAGRSFERITAAGLKTFARLTPAAARFIDRTISGLGKVGISGGKGLGKLALTGAKGAAFGAGAGAGMLAMKGAASVVSAAAGSIVGSFGLIGTAAAAMWGAVTGGLSMLISLAGSIAGGIGKITMMASDFNELDSQFKQVFGDSAPMAEDALNKLAVAQGRSRAQMMGMGASMQSLLVPLGFAKDKAAEMSVTAAQLAIDMASFKNVSDEQAIEDITAAISGSGEVMKKYGVVINEATMKTELAKMGYHGASEAATENMKALARMNIIIEGTADAHGDAVKTGGGFANTMKRIMGAVQDIGTSLGHIFLPAAETFAQFFADTLGLVDSNTEGLETWGDTLKTWAEEVVMWLNRLITLFMNWGEISTQAGNVVAAVVRESLAVMDIMLTNVEAGLITLGQNIADFFPNLFAAIAENHGSLWDFMKKGWGEIWEYIKSGGTDAIDIDFEKIVSDMKSKFKSADFKPIETSEALAEWGRLTSIIDEKMNAAKRKAEEVRKIEKFTAAGTGVDMGKDKKIKFELVAATDLFSNILKEQFDSDKEGEKLEWAKKGVAVAEDGVAATREVAAELRAVKADLTKPVMGT